MQSTEIIGWYYVHVSYAARRCGMEVSMTELICIVCPRGCRLAVDEQNSYAVSGQGCTRGVQYGKDELINPVRVLTSTVRISGADRRQCPVKTKNAIPKGFVFSAMRLLRDIELAAPVSEGQVIIEDVCGTGIPIVATRDIMQAGAQQQPEFCIQA